MEMLTAMITPYREDGSVDCETAEKYVEWYYNAGLDGIFAICQSGEIFFLSLEALSAKYHMTLCGMETGLITRNPACKPLTDYDKNCVEQIKTATDFLEKHFGI